MTNTENAIAWEEPPSMNDARHAGSKRVWEPLFDRLRERPGEWARIRELDSPDTASTSVSRLRAGLVAGVDPSEFEVISRTVDGKGMVYARYIT